MHFVLLFLSFFSLPPALLSVQKRAPARRTSLHTFALSTRLSILPFLLPLFSLSLSLSLSHTLSLLSLRSRSMGRGPIRTHVALVGKIEATSETRAASRFSGRRDGSPSSPPSRRLLGSDSTKLARETNTVRRARRRISRTFQLTDDNSS